MGALWIRKSVSIVLLTQDESIHFMILILQLKHYFSYEPYNTETKLLYHLFSAIFPTQDNYTTAYNFNGF